MTLYGRIEVTPEAMDSARYLVRSFFSDAVYALYDRAMRTEISIMSTPNASFEGAREQAVLAMAEELRIRPRGAFGKVSQTPPKPARIAQTAASIEPRNFYSR